MSPLDPNPEAAMVHAKVQEKARGDAFGGPKCMWIDSCTQTNRCVMGGDCELHQPSAAFLELPHEWRREANALNRPPVPEAKPEPGTLPGFDSEAHRAFMRNLG